jgi:hypothetical protein
MDIRHKAQIIAMVIAVCFFTVIFGMAAAYAEDKIIEKKVDGIVFKKDKNGNQYARIFITDTAEINGVQYPKTMSVMAFGDAAMEAKNVKKGQTLKAVVQEQDFRGSKSYLLLKVL